MTDILDTLEVDFGVEILSDLADEPLTRNGQRCRILDDSQTSSETFYLADKQGKPYVQNFRDGVRLYPVTAYAKAFDLSFHAASLDLQQKYGLRLSEAITGTRQRIAKKPITKEVAAPDCLPPHCLDYVRKGYNKNGLTQYLRTIFGVETARWLIDRYWLGTSKHWRFGDNLATILPQIDYCGRIRQIKVMVFNPDSGSRLKKNHYTDVWNDAMGKYQPDKIGNDKIYFLGRDLIGKANPNLTQCFFGEHLLTLEPQKPVALVEAESTALVCSVYLPEFIWLATCGSAGCRWSDPAVFSVLRDRDVFLFPDNGFIRPDLLAYEDWRQKADILRSQRIARSITVNDLLHKNSLGPTDKRDLRDFLVIRDQTTGFALHEGYPVFWDLPNPHYQAGKASDTVLSPGSYRVIDQPTPTTIAGPILPTLIATEKPEALTRMTVKNSNLQALISSLDLALI